MSVRHLLQEWQSLWEAATDQEAIRRYRLTAKHPETRYAHHFRANARAGAELDAATKLHRHTGGTNIKHDVEGRKRWSPAPGTPTQSKLRKLYRKLSRAGSDHPLIKKYRELRWNAHLHNKAEFSGERGSGKDLNLLKRDVVHAASKLDTAEKRVGREPDMFKGEGPRRFPKVFNRHTRKRAGIRDWKSHFNKDRKPFQDFSKDRPSLQKRSASPEQGQETK